MLNAGWQVLPRFSKGGYIMYNRINNYLEQHQILAHVLLCLEGVAIGIMFALAI